MRIKMYTSAAGPDGSFQEGHVYHVPHHISAEQAQQFVQGGYASDISDPETASIAPAETATAAPQRRKRRK